MSLRYVRIYNVASYKSSTTSNQDFHKVKRTENIYKCITFFIQMKNISFIIPNYNGEKTIGKVIESILSQDYKKGKVEIIVLDDGSKDKNLCEVGSTNKGIKISKYEIISIILCDYILDSKDWLSKMVKAINSSNDIGMVGTDVILPKKLWDQYKFWDRVVLSPVFDKEFKGDIKKGKPVMYKKEVFDRLGLYDESYKMGADTDMRLKILNAGYKISNPKTRLLHYHGYYGLTPMQQIFKKSLPLTEAAGVIFRRYNFLVHKYWSYWNPLTATTIYIGLFIPYLNYLSLIAIIAISGYYTYLVSKYNKDIRLVFVPFFKILKDVVSLFGFWKGFITNKQTF